MGGLVFYKPPKMLYGVVKEKYSIFMKEAIIPQSEGKQKDTELGCGKRLFNETFKNTVYCHQKRNPENFRTSFL